MFNSLLPLSNRKQLFKYRRDQGLTDIQGFSEWLAAVRIHWTPKKEKEEFELMKMNKGFKQPVACVDQVTQEIMLGCIKTAPMPGCNVPFDIAKQEKEDTMDTRTEAQQAKDYLIKGEEAAMWNQLAKAEDTFNLKTQRPATVKELRDAIAKGFLVVDEKYDDKAGVYYWQDFVEYVDPAKKPDRAGYNAAEKQIRSDASDVKDQIVVFGPEKGLEALNAFKAKAYN